MLQQLLGKLLRNSEDRFAPSSSCDLVSIENELTSRLISEQVIQRLPWEAVAILKSTPVSRIPSLHMLHCLAMKHGLVANRIPAPSTDLKLRNKVIEVNPKLTFYVVNPESNLPGTQERMQPILEEIWGKNSGVVGVAPAELQIKESLTQQDLFL